MIWYDVHVATVAAAYNAGVPVYAVLLHDYIFVVMCIEHCAIQNCGSLWMLT